MKHSSIDELIRIMAALRTPGTGCPWDLEQDFASIAPYTIEEAYEVADAIQRGDMEDLRDELGDVLLQVVFHARMAEERGYFAFDDVVEAICAKMVRRHPHVFGGVKGRDVGEVNVAWGEIKAEEKRLRAARRAAKGLPDEGRARALAEVPTALPALSRATKIQQSAARVGFDWPHAAPVVDKIREELAEVEAEMTIGDRAAAALEVGDLLFAVANLARHLGVEPEAALRATNEKFIRRFARVEDALAMEGRTPVESSLEEMEVLWQAAKSPILPGQAS